MWRSERRPQNRAIAKIHSAQEKAEAAISGKSGRTDRPRISNRGQLPAHLTPVERLIEPVSMMCPCGCGPMTMIKTSPSVSNVIPAQFRVLVVELECGAGGFRPNISVAAPFVWRCLTSSPVAPVSTPRSSNRTCRSPASGSRTRSHAFTHDGPRPSWVRRTSWKCPYRCESG